MTIKLSKLVNTSLYTVKR